MEKDELQSALEEAESALEQEENKVLRAQMDLAQAKQEIERRLQEKEEEFENTRKNFARALDSMQASLDGEMKAKEEVNFFFILKLVSLPTHGLLNRWTAMSSFFLLQVDSMRRELGTQIAPRG